jgi:hypothetical protein
MLLVTLSGFGSRRKKRLRIDAVSANGAQFPSGRYTLSSSISGAGPNFPQESAPTSCGSNFILAFFESSVQLLDSSSDKENPARTCARSAPVQRVDLCCASFRTTVFFFTTPLYDGCISESNALKKLPIALRRNWIMLRANGLAATCGVGYCGRRGSWAGVAQISSAPFFFRTRHTLRLPVAHGKLAKVFDRVPRP